MKRAVFGQPFFVLQLTIMKHICTIIILCIVTCAKAQEAADKDSLAADFTYLVNALEETHPDPYSGFGGKVFFHKEATDLLDNLRENPCTTQEFCFKVSAFLANIQDGHTALDYSTATDNSVKRYLPLQIRVIPGHLILSGLPANRKEFLGSRIDCINGESVDVLLQHTAKTIACENAYGSYAQLSANLCHPSLNTKLFPDEQESMLFTVETPAGVKESFRLDYINREEWKNYSLSKLPEWDKVPSSSYMSYTYLDSQKQVMLFKLTSIMARENFEVTIRNGWDNAYGQLKDFYQSTLKKEMPADTIQALAGVPSFSEVFLQMLKDMKKNKSQVLIIDLRFNGGGWTPITLPALYMLYGDKYLKTDMKTTGYKLISPLLLKKQGETLEEFNKHYDPRYKIGDYMTMASNAPDTSDMEALRHNFTKHCMSHTKAELEKQSGDPAYSPAHVYVLTDEWTFSAAFHFAFYLWKMGATIVGVPTRQAPNTFMETTPYYLPYTKLSGSISNNLQQFLPAKDRRAKTFWPDLMLSYEDYKKYNFDKHAEIQYLLDLINGNRQHKKE